MRRRMGGAPVCGRYRREHLVVRGRTSTCGACARDLDPCRGPLPLHSEGRAPYSARLSRRLSLLSLRPSPASFSPLLSPPLPFSLPFSFSHFPAHLPSFRLPTRQHTHRSLLSVRTMALAPSMTLASEQRVRQLDPLVLYTYLTSAFLTHTRPPPPPPPPPFLLRPRSPSSFQSPIVTNPTRR